MMCLKLAHSYTIPTTHLIFSISSLSHTIGLSV
nr:MAG TPA: hypothetical protein [Caudoviricetes sp.]